ncbi:MULTISPECIES: WecB/TagA/CpsF family glycosyltransferase [unclassified Pseudomonas]|uniref:WecB/TagA/CpsF family glycosyltransferase n=1 Tax=unclassified Pseudomonas TaxID=196821 RepID=UPI00177E6950|nr:WecB/TagA/CpsF family glycosyltransferase [Pseudomonas sp. PDM12]MBD9655750.1 WecB/TagA/CpsF family glycosyltransferase [Pseudomonas sp. PDM12]
MKTSQLLYDPVIHKLKLLEEHDVTPLLNELSAPKKPTIVGFLNQHGYNLIQQDERARRHFLQVNYLLRDGIGIKLACALNGLEPGANLNGTDFIPALIEHALHSERGEQYQLFAMGTCEPWTSEGASALFNGRSFHAIDGFQPLEDYLQFVQQHLEPGKIPLIVMGMGMPRQEEVAVRLQRQLGRPALMICGGAILDFAAQRFNRAPAAIRKVGMEWAYRLLMEPRRLFARYVIGIPQFFYYIVRNGRDSNVEVSEQGAYNRKS